jgi:anthranilate phosphoribosyltransferase
MTGGFNWGDTLGALLDGGSLTEQQCRAAMAQIVAGDATPAQIAGFVVALRAKGETAPEVIGLVEAMLDVAVPLPYSGPALDIVGTGGDRSHSVNISTLSAIVAAGAGAVVIKHGNRAASSRCGSADVLEELGVRIDLDPDGVLACVDRAGIGFCFAPVFHPAMRFAGPPRRELGIPTVFNILGPLANPAQPSASLVGVPRTPRP